MQIDLMTYGEFNDSETIFDAVVYDEPYSSLYQLAITFDKDGNLEGPLSVHKSHKILILSGNSKPEFVDLAKKLYKNLVV